MARIHSVLAILFLEHRQEKYDNFHLKWIFSLLLGSLYFPARGVNRICIPLILCTIVCVSVRSPLEKTRYDTSLGLLTKKFVGLIKNAPDGVGTCTCIYIVVLEICL